MKGHVVGVNTAMIAGAQGLCFSNPIDSAVDIASKLMRHRRIIRAYLGLACSTVRLTRRQIRWFGLNLQSAARILEVQPNSPAAASRLVPGDLSVSIGNVPISNADSMYRFLTDGRIGENMSVVVLRGYDRVELAIIPGMREAVYPT